MNKKARKVDVKDEVTSESSMFCQETEVTQEEVQTTCEEATCEEPDFTIEDKEWIDEIEAKQLTLKDIL